VVAAQQVEYLAGHATGRTLVQPVYGGIKTKVFSPETRKVSTGMRFFFQHAYTHACFAEYGSCGKAAYTGSYYGYVIIRFNVGLLHQLG
jgi:hypothetical protein